MKNLLCLLTLAIFGLLISPADTFAADDQIQTENILTDESPQIVCTVALTTDAISTGTVSTETRTFAERKKSKSSNKKFKRKTNRTKNRSSWLFPGNSDNRIRTCGAYN